MALSAGCDKAFLERLPLTEISEANLWSDPALTRGFVADMYGRLDHGHKLNMLAVATDEAIHNHGWNTELIVQGTLTPDAERLFAVAWADRWQGKMSNTLEWRHLYPLIRDANLFLDKIDRVPFADAGEKDQITGEVYLLRAWNYFALLRLYGGVPIVDRVFGLDETDAILQTTRASFAETVDFILSDIDKSLPLLGEGADVPSGLLHKSAAKALKARVLLHVASDLYNQPGNTNALLGYTGVATGDRTARWTAARDAAKAIIDEGKYSLYAPSGNPTEDYTNIFLDKGNVEVIFRKIFDRSLGITHEQDMVNGPNGYEGWITNQPTQNFVDVYQMADGTPFDWNNAAHAADPYNGRDPRFRATVFHNGSPWRKRIDPATASQDPVGIIQTLLKYEYWDGTKTVERVGLESKQGPIYPWNGTKTGYVLRKFMDITNTDPLNFKSDVDYIHFRYAEILLNHAEACIELGQEADARASLKLVRERAGMPGVDAASGTALRDLYRYERRVELAFECHRFYDARRWMTAEVDFSENARGVEITGKLKVPNDNSAGLDYTYKVLDIQPRSFPKKMYFMPIPAGEIRANPNLDQNPGY